MTERRLWDIIPDIHGEADKLIGLLGLLGYGEVLVDGRAVWLHPDPARRAVFLGDFIDRGPDQARVLSIVRAMVALGGARAVMGNHEFNALAFHARHPATGAPLRAHSPANLRQHAAFLAEFPPGAAETRAALDWMMDLPLFLDFGEFRVVHACWDPAAIAVLTARLVDDRLNPELLVEATEAGSDLYAAVETVLKGPECELPEGYGYHDKGGHPRRRARLAWWNGVARGWADITASVPEGHALPEGDAPEELRAATYPAKAPPVFFGHYWRRDAVGPSGANTFCLDFSAGDGGPLVAYAQGPDAAGFDPGRVTRFG